MTTQELKDAGVNLDNLVYPNGEMNIIVQQFQVNPKESDEKQALPDIYHPRTNKIYSCGETGNGYSLVTKEDQEEYAKHLLDSSERLKIMSILLAKQAQELLELGEIRTTCYYPEGSDWYELNKSK